MYPQAAKSLEVEEMVLRHSSQAESEEGSEEVLQKRSNFSDTHKTVQAMRWANWSYTHTHTCTHTHAHTHTHTHTHTTHTCLPCSCSDEQLLKVCEGRTAHK